MRDLLIRRRNLLIRKREEEMNIRAVCFEADGEQTDAYNKGDKVTYNGKHWVSTADANVWQPGVYGWDKV